MTENRSQITDDRKQMSDNRCQTTDDRLLKKEGEKVDKVDWMIS